MPTLIENKKARHDFEILETLEAGIALSGQEVKSLRSGRGSLAGAHVTVRGGEAYLLNANIPPYQPRNAPRDYEAERPRRLLFSRKELSKLARCEAQGGLTIVPLLVYTKGRFLKLSIAIVRGKKKYDKRETLKKRGAEREIKRELKRHFNI